MTVCQGLGSRRLSTCGQCWWGVEASGGCSSLNASVQLLMLSHIPPSLFGPVPDAVTHVCTAYDYAAAAGRATGAAPVRVAALAVVAVATR